MALPVRSAASLVKDGAGLERLAGIDTVLFDKTGVLTLESHCVVNAGAAIARPVK